jgi:hypothetical protein
MVRGLIGAVTASVLGAEALWRPAGSQASGFARCDCLNFVPEGYTCAGGTLYLAGHYVDCYTHEFCFIEWTVVGCCYG